MNIRARLSLTFFAIVVVVLIVTSIAVYFFAENDRSTDFYRRLRNRAVNTARVITEIKEVSADLQRRLESDNPSSLPDQYIVIIDSLGREIYRSSGTQPMRIDSAVKEKIRSGEEIRYSNDGREFLGFRFRNSEGTYIILAMAWDQFGHQSIDHLQSILVLTFIGSMILVSVLSWFYSGRVLAPISKIISNVGNISEKNLNLRLDEGNQTDELSQLAKTFNDMLSRLQNSFSSQKSFIANASHEIKTPITIMSGEIEVALLQERDKTYYTRVLNSVLTGLRKLNNLSTKLLLLAESTSQDTKRKFALFRLDDTLWETKDWLQRAYPNYDVEIEFDISINADAFAMMGDEHLIRAALLNLMDNGCKYSTDNHVSIFVDTNEPGWLTLSFVNSGMITGEELPKIFSPFFRSASNKNERGFGIGLPLVANVVNLHNGQLSVVSGNGITQFKLKLPVDPRSQ
jgi:signal transduction histidine kinase